MSKIAIATDSNSGITQAEAATMGISVVPMPFYIDDKLYFEGVDISQEEFYKVLATGVDVKTSQPGVEQLTGLWDELLKEYDEVVYIPMTSGLSGACHTAIMLSEDYEGRVQVVDNHRISLTLVGSIEDAQKMATEGYSAAQIKEKLEEESYNASIYIAIDDLKYLKKGGRVTAAGAAVGTILGIKPVLQIQGGKLDAFSKARGLKAAKRVMLDALDSDLKGRFKTEHEEGKMVYAIAYSGDPAKAWEFRDELVKRFPDADPKVYPLGLSIGCHTGDGALGCAVYKTVG